MSAIRKFFGTNYIDSYYTKLYQVGFVESLSFLNACYLTFELRVVRCEPTLNGYFFWQVLHSKSELLRGEVHRGLND